MNLGMPEVLLILVIALIVFGPRKLPELGKSLGQAMAQFRRASDDFKRSWEQEVELEKTRKSESPTAESAYAGADSTYHDGSPEETHPTEPPTAGAEATAKTAETVAATTAPMQEKPRSEHWI